MSGTCRDQASPAESSYRGAKLIQQLINESSLPAVQFYMKAIQNTAENAVRKMLKEVYRKFEGRPLQAEDYMDDGSTLRLKIDIDPEKGDAVFDFTGTTAQM